MKKIIEKLTDHHSLSSSEAYTLMMDIGNGRFSEIEIASLLTVYRMRNMQVQELFGFSEALLSQSVKIDLYSRNVLDMCGTGGDRKSTFNISTLAALVVAGAGYSIAKHGNYGVSSASGSSTVMQKMGVTFTRDPSLLNRQLEKTNFCFIHAPYFHPILMSLAPLRKKLGVPTLFNCMGPLINPARPVYRFTGVYNLEIAELYKQLLNEQHVEFKIIHSLDGFDEISLTHPFRVIDRTGQADLLPEEIGERRLQLSDLNAGLDADSACAIFKNVLEGKATRAQNRVVCVNAAFAITCINPAVSIGEAMNQANESLRTKKAKRVFTNYLNLN